ncbi:alr0857 family protein [Laspinema olomoucense]|uniref:alr0857 family protein n=1 Tax=Laspinema olomoucense TaxID=3231600 RepID=UPI0021BB9929|nr:MULTISPECIES: alr0857 family protein [unclassified Laspinema]MCT7976079.1 hypothetical protein [Laspinema sp. D3d]MCT7993640.1 hypothetical protein [Laspinema sp. D3c]
MLKFIYTETGFNLERLPDSIEEVVATRAVVAMRVGESIAIAPSSASFLLPVDLPGLKFLEAEALNDPGDMISICVADSEYVEVSLRGTWISTDSQNDFGVFVTALSDRAEFYILKCSEEAKAGVSLLKEVD